MYFYSDKTTNSSYKKIQEKYQTLGDESVNRTLSESIKANKRTKNIHLKYEENQIMIHDNKPT